MRIVMQITPLLICCLVSFGCGSPTQRNVSLSGVSSTQAKVEIGSDGLTAEQRNIKGRLKQDNSPGAIKHLYVFSAVSGQCLLYSTVREKVTSSGKRLSPSSVIASDRQDIGGYGLGVNIGGSLQRTTEVLQDDGTYGSSIEYLYWFDVSGNYRQFYPSAGAIVVVSTTPLSVKSVVVPIEAVKGD